LAFWPGSAEGQARSFDEHIHYCAQATPRCARINTHPLDRFGAFVKYIEYSATGFVETHRALEKGFHRAYLCLTMPHLNNRGDKVLGIVRAGEAAIPFIMGIERTAGFERLVGRCVTPRMGRLLETTNLEHFPQNCWQLDGQVGPA
jgi:hypothetical protein